MTLDADRTVAIIQARMGSERLAGKVLAHAAGKPLLGWLLDQLAVAESLDEVIVAIPTGANDEPIARYCKSRGTRCIAGPEQDVLARYLLAARACDAATLLRITADCPLLDAETVDRNVAGYFSAGCEYSFNEVPENIPRGYDVEVMSRDTLERLGALSGAPEEREHVTFYIERHPEAFSILRFHDPAFPQFPPVRLCVDTEADLNLVSRILTVLERQGGPIPPEAVLELLRREPELARINADVRQKEF